MKRLLLVVNNLMVSVGWQSTRCNVLNEIMSLPSVVKRITTLHRLIAVSCLVLQSYQMMTTLNAHIHKMTAGKTCFFDDTDT